MIAAVFEKKNRMLHSSYLVAHFFHPNMLFCIHSGLNTISLFLLHHNDVIMSAMACQITGVSIICSTFFQAQIKESIKALRHWPLWGESTGDQGIPSQRANNAENVSIWWRHYDKLSMLVFGYPSWLCCDANFNPFNTDEIKWIWIKIEDSEIFLGFHHQIEADTKWPPFWRLTSSFSCMEMVLFCDLKITDIYSQWCS